ncbi:MAG TPA: sensor histidine kinase [Lacunisphaera sp.]|nr:sensor histidine kinase [Lacunisphaera sp.]
MPSLIPFPRARAGALPAPVARPASALRRLRRITLAAALRLMLLGGTSAGALSAVPAVAAISGLPFSRVYSLEDIGYVPRGSRLGFDAFGRIAVIHDGVYSVLNDTVWLNQADTTSPDRVALSQVVRGRDGRTYYGALGSWGRAEIQADGKLHTTPLGPAGPADWTQATTFEDILVTKDGVYFASRQGVVFWDPAREKSQRFEIARLSKVFRVGDRIFVSRFDQPLMHLDGAGGKMTEIPSLILDGGTDNVVERATELDDNRSLLSLLNGRLVVFDGTHATQWPGQTRNHLTGPIAALQRLADDHIAVSITNQGVFVLSADGELRSTLTIPQYHRVSDIASREPGVMWLINEDSVEKILYGSGLTWFGQRLGLSPEWPLIVNWNGRTIASSRGILHEAVPAGAGNTSRFERLEAQPLNGAWAAAAHGRHLLVGNPTGLYAVSEDLRFVPLDTVGQLSHLVMVDEDLCYAIGRQEIALFAWDGERWTEPVPRIPGVRNPSVVHRAGRAAWIEMGGEGVARVHRQGDRLELMVVRNEPWTKSLWVNVGVVDDTVVLSGHRNERRFFSEATGDWCERPELDRLLNRSPEWLARVRSDASGNLWATHNEGLVRFTPRGKDYEMDALTYDLISDRYPTVQVLPGNEVWVSSSRSLYHVEPTASTSVRPFTAPILVSLTDARRGVDLLSPASRRAGALQFPYDQNSLTFRFFSGSYAWRRTPQYEFRLQPGEPWSALDNGAILRFSGLHEGHYQLQVRIAGQPASPGTPLNLPFTILPPWHRTAPAYALYGLLAALAIWGAIRWSGLLARKRNRALEQLVKDRTGELESTMAKLNEKTRISATLAERDRLAGEIHDSVQQGLSGAILQLDTTLTLPALTGNVRARLNVVRNMVSYARQEVQHAVWDMESPLLEGNDLGAALRKLSTLMTSGKVAPRVEVSGTPVALPRPATRHLLRIAQEATTNALRHAGAQEIIIRLDYQPEAVVLAIRDDGTGFQPESVLNQAGHFGLRGIRTRVKKLRGTLAITSADGEGTTLQVHVPLSAAPSHEHDAENHRQRPHPNPVG